MGAVCVFLLCLGHATAAFERVTLAHDVLNRATTERVVAYERRWMVAGFVDQLHAPNAVFGGVLPLRLSMKRLTVEGGAVVASERVPVSGTRANFMALLQVGISRRITFTYWHWSNAHLGTWNPSVDAIGLSIRFRRTR
jgi:hypothetical protein